VNGRSWTGQYLGARASCVVDEGYLYHLNAHGLAVCLDVSTGLEKWAVEILERFDAAVITWGLSECLLVDGPRLIVTSGGKKGAMAALDKKSGETFWTSAPVEEIGAGYGSSTLFGWVAAGISLTVPRGTSSGWMLTQAGIFGSA
jgi:outer membrane protein assembly factor BamB